MKKSLKRILCAMLVLVFVFANANVALAVDYVPKTMVYNPPMFYSSTTTTSSVDLSVYITDVEAFQADILEQLKVDTTGELDVSKYNVPGSYEYFVALCNLIRDESPELIRINPAGYFSCTYYNTISSIGVEYLFDDPAYFQQEYELFLDKTKELVSGIKDNSTLNDVEKALLLHDRLATCCEYDYENYQLGIMVPASHSAYGAICLGTAVCQGYAYAYDYLLEQVGIKSEYCSSDVINHAWNIVYIDDKPYHVDVTWDDPVRDVTGRVFHDNFLRSTQGIIETDHIGDDGTVDFITTPVDTTYDNYFWQNTNASFEVIGDKIYYKDGDSYTIYAISDINDGVTGNAKELIAGRDVVSYSTKIGSAYGLLYFSGDDAVYSYNPTNGETVRAITPDDIAKDKEQIGSDYEIWGMSIWGCELLLEYYNWSGENTYIYIEKKLHEEASEWTVVTPATTTTKGEKVLKCTKCEDILKTKEIPVIGEHTCDWSAWQTTEEATCSKEGKQISKCSICYEEKTQTLKKLEHNFTEHTIPPTCGDLGSRYKECSSCGASVLLETIPATGNHNSNIEILGYDSTCAKIGYTNGSKCSTCGTITKAQEVIPTKNHTTTVINIKESTCNKAGYTGDTYCTTCKTVTHKGTATAVKPHTTTVVNVTSATIEANGYTGDTVCTVCGTVTAYGTAIPKLTLSAPVITSLQVTTGGVKFTWGAVPYAAKYKIYRKTYHPSTGTWDSKWKKINKVEVKGTEYVDGTAKLGTQYMYLIKAVNGKATKNSAASSAITFKISPTPTAYLKSNGIKVKWPETVVSAESYRIYRADFNEATGKYNSYKKVKTVKGTTKSWTDTTVVSGKKYKYCVKAVRGKVVCDKVQTKSIYFLVKPTATAANTGNGIAVNWNQIQGATSFKIYRASFQNGAWTGYSHIATVSPTTSYLDSATVPGVQYKYKVKAVKSKTGVTSSATAAVIR